MMEAGLSAVALLVLQQPRKVGIAVHRRIRLMVKRRLMPKFVLLLCYARTTWLALGLFSPSLRHRLSLFYCFNYGFKQQSCAVCTEYCVIEAK